MRGELKENEENRGLNDKKASQDQFTYFCQFIIWLSHSFSHTLAKLEYFWSILGAFGIY